MHPAVLECGVHRRARSGARVEAVKVFVVIRPGSAATAEELREHCRANLTPYKVPKSVVFRESLPKTAIGKILRRELEQTEASRAA